MELVSMRNCVSEDLLEIAVLVEKIKNDFWNAKILLSASWEVDAELLDNWAKCLVWCSQLECFAFRILTMPKAFLNTT